MSGKGSIKTIIFALIIFFSSCEVTRYVVYNMADLNDYRLFPFREIKSCDSKFCFEVAAGADTRIPQRIVFQKKEIGFEQFLSEKKTVAFLVIHNDSILYEHYF